MDEMAAKGGSDLGLVVVVDDSRRPMEDYIHGIMMVGFDAIQFFGPDSLFAFLEAKEPAVVAFVIDLMMPPGEKYGRVDTDEGLATGVFVYSDIRMIPRYAAVPVIVLTNSTNQATLGRFPADPYLRIGSKLDYPPSRLNSHLRSVIGE